MPPKKKPDKKKEQEEERPGYNVDVMTLDQLKQYARLLESEIEDFRRHCNFYQKMEDKLAEVLKITEEDLRNNEDQILAKDMELEQLQLKFQKHLQEKKQWPKYMEDCHSRKKDELLSETNSQIEKEEERHLEETERLQSILQEKDKNMESLRVKIEIARRETIEENESYLKVMTGNQEELLQKAVERFDEVLKETEIDFKQAKEAMEQEAHEGKIEGERALNNACAAFKQKLQDYYKDVTKEDLETIKMLKNKIRKVEETIKNSKILLEKAVKENKILKESTKQKFTNRSSSYILTKFNADPANLMEAFRIHNKIEKLCLENQNLEEEIKNILEKTCNLKAQFTSALEKVRDSAEMKSVFLEKKLNCILDDKEGKSVNDQAKSS